MTTKDLRTQIVETILSKLAIYYEPNDDFGPTALLCADAILTLPAIANSSELLEALKECHRVLGVNLMGHRKHGKEYDALKQAWEAITKASPELVLDPIDAATGEGRR